MADTSVISLAYKQVRDFAGPDASLAAVWCGRSPSPTACARVCLFAAAVLLLALAAVPACAEKIPLASGGEIDVDILEFTDTEILIVTAKGFVEIPWTRISTAYPKHPQHRESSSRTDADLGPAGARDDVDAGLGSSARRPADETDEAAVESGGFARALFLVFIVFWLHILSVWLVSREDLTGGATYQAWNLAALLLGLPVVAVFMIKYKGWLGRRGAEAGPSAMPACCLYTWDGKPVKEGANRNLQSGLTLAENILARAVKMNASDVHFDTAPDGVKMAYRVDGVLRAPEMLAAVDGKRAVTAIRTAAGMDVAKRHEAQDGACHLMADGASYDLRIARAWAVTGETVTIRLLNAGGLGAKLTDLGMSAQMADEMRRLARETAGIVVMAGPTGSGKTSTIYALLRQVVGTGRNILTIEDPVEYRLEGATQISLNARVGTTFASALKASMRHDPDVILVGEIRDSEAMDVAFQAALTGHLVFTTIHASSVLATYGRLQELGLSSYMINTGMKAVVCQRLVRKLCPSCREPYAPDLHELDFWGLTRQEHEGHCFYKPVGCALCEDTGYHGRVAVYRVLIMNNELRARIQPDIPTGELQELVEEYASGHVKQYARDLLWPGETAAEELQRTLDMFDFGKQMRAPERTTPGQVD